MSFFVYLAVVLFAAASALFGLDLMTAPLPPSKPSTQVASVSAPATPDKLAKREAEQKTADKQASNSDRALSPVYPASPGGAKPDVRMVYPPTNAANATTGAATTEEKSAPAQPQNNQVATTAQPETKQPAPAVQPPQQQPSQQAAEPPKQKQASVEPRDNQPSAAQPEVTAKQEPRAPAPVAPAPVEANSTPAAQPATQQTANHCDVQACAGAYQSFRASDCTYQPFSGPRRVCDAPPAAQKSAERTLERARPRLAEDSRLERTSRQSRRDTELQNVVRSVREMTARDAREVSAEDDDNDDAPARGGGRVIVIQRSGGFWR